MAYRPFAILDPKTGLLQDREPWRALPDAFTDVNNIYLKDGYWKKRNGYELLANVGTSNPITGIMHYVTSSNERELLVSDTERLYKYNEGTGAFTDLDGADVFNAGRGDFQRWVNWDGYLYMVNGKSQQRRYDGSTVANFTCDISGTGTNVITTARAVAVSKERLIFFATTETTDGFTPQRARWSAAGDPTDWTGDEYVDAPTSDHIRAVGQIGDDMIVFFDNSVWTLKYTNDPELPFRWDQVSTFTGCAAPLSPMRLPDRYLFLGRAGIAQTDGIQVGMADSRIPDYVIDNFDQDAAVLCFGLVLQDQRQAWMTYPSSGAEAPDKVLVFDYENGGWTVFDIAMNVLGYYYEAAAPLTWENATGTWTGGSYEYEWTGETLAFGYPTILGGDDSGNVFKMNTGESDNSTAIASSMTSARLNPFIEQGFKSRLGYIDFLVETDADVSVSVDFYNEFESAAHTTATLDFSGDTGSKQWVRVFCNAVGETHKIKIYDNQSQVWKLHGMIWFFDQAGRAF